MEMTTQSIDAYEHAGRLVAREHRRSAAAVIYCGLVAGILRRQEIATGTAELQSEHLIEALCGDRLGNAAANDLGLGTCLQLMNWISGGWDHISWRAGEERVPTPDPAEQHHRCVAEERAVEAGTEGVSLAAVAVFAGVVAAARVRWRAGGEAWGDPNLVVAAVIEGDPAAEAARDELDEGLRNGAAWWISKNWDEIVAAAQDLAALDQIAGAA
ncbi:hypothetical protein JNN96_29825 [Mycobacterium sp. DSM 3803]|nr:hypothetical protein [Mycobacterium sp. DSM 3803]